MSLLLLLTAGLFLPLYPFSILPNLLLQGQVNGTGAPGPAWRRGPGFKAAVLLGFPILGVGLVGLATAASAPPEPLMLNLFGVWGGLTSVIYAFRLLSAKDGEIWISHLYSSTLALIWIGIAIGLNPLLPAIGLSVSLLPLVVLLDQLTRRFGIARCGLYPGLGLSMPLFAYLFIAAVLAAIAVPFSPSFFAITALAFGGVAANAALYLVPIGLSWVLWTWAGVNLLQGIIWGVPRDDLTYRDLERDRALGVGAGLVTLGFFGILLVEVAL